MTTKVLHTESAPAAIGPYVQGVDLGNMVMTSGQIPLDPVTGECPSDIQQQALQSLKNVKAVVESSGLTVADIVKMTVFVKDLNQFAAINEVYGQFFDQHDVAHYPARSCVEVARLPKDVGIEIEAIALRK
ncbi:RidA family protein [Vibrio sp. S4M6]|uniref:RidA family protein n=1 Tax=Vibrio sinus TaxID=2946865 RepID=UPI00202A2AC0|nr:RidA family protein [Vibrio sinus]MCL9780563.1 RidA family protein [Vibrio sinus]